MRTEKNQQFRIAKMAGATNQTNISEEPINDNAEPPANAITLTDLAALVGADEDVLLQRLAGILRKRENDRVSRWMEPA